MWTCSHHKKKNHRIAFPQRCSEAKESASSAACSRMPPITATQASIFRSFEVLLVKMMRSRVYFSASGAIWTTSGNTLPTWSVSFRLTVRTVAGAASPLPLLLPCPRMVTKLTLRLQILLTLPSAPVSSAGIHHPLASVVKASSRSVFLKKWNLWNPENSSSAKPRCAVF